MNPTIFQISNITIMKGDKKELINTVSDYIASAQAREEGRGKAGQRGIKKFIKIKNMDSFIQVNLMYKYIPEFHMLKAPGSKGNISWFAKNNK